MRITSVVALFPDLPEAELTSWVVRGWVRPDWGDLSGDDPIGSDPNGGNPGAGGADTGGAGAGWEFLEIDVARVRLIHDLHRAMEINEETMPLVLSLLDQVYALRGTLREMLRALGDQPDDVRTALLAALRRD
jgi:chaperone modulatory protein CbpM